MLTAHRRLALPLWVNGLAVIPHSRSSVTGTSARRVWYDVAGLLRRKELAIEIVEAEIRSAQQSFRLGATTRAFPPAGSTSAAGTAPDACC
jgi:hypothetical protein